MAIITYPLNGITYDATDAETYLNTRTSGVFDSDESFALSVVGGRSVSIGKGQAWIKNEEFAGKSVCNTASVMLSFDLADGSLNRYDRVVLRFNKTNSRSELAVLKGQSASTPTPPTITRTSEIYELGLYLIYFPAGSTTISLSDVTDTRADASVCGRMSDGVSGLNEMQQEIDKLTNITHVTLLASGWTSSSLSGVAWEQTVTVYGARETSEFDWYLDCRPTEAQYYGYSYISAAEGLENRVRFTCVSDKPTADLPIKIRGI